jgi:hypothetical protein
MTAAAALASLKADPKGFLWNNLITVAGGSTYGTSNAILWNMGAKYRIDVNNNTPSDGQAGLTVWNFPMIKNSQAIAWNAVPHTHVTGTDPGVIVTGMLTGCTIAIVKESDTSLRLCHVQPGGVRPGAYDTEDQIRANARLNGTAPTHFYGPSKYRPEVHRAHLIGVAVGGSWQVWGQCIGGDGGNSILALSRLI